MASKKTAKPKAAAKAPGPKAAKASKAKEPKAAKGKSAKLAADKARAAVQVAEAQTARQLPGAKKLKDLARAVTLAQDRSSTAAGEAGSLITDAVKKIHLNAKPFKACHALLKQGNRDPVKLRTYLDDFDYYREALELDKLAGESLFETTPEGPVQEDDEDDGAETSSADDTPDEDAPPPADEFDQSGNVHRIGRGQAA